MKRAIFSLLAIVCLLTSCSKSAMTPKSAEDWNVTKYVYNYVNHYDLQQNPARTFSNLWVTESNPTPEEEREKEEFFKKKAELDDSEKPYHVKLMNWYYNEDVSGDTYEGYFFIYKVCLVFPRAETSKIYYAVVNLVEFDDGSSEYKVEYVSGSLADCESIIGY